MFNRSIDAKSTYTYNGVQMKDLTEPIFKSNAGDITGLLSYYKVSKEMQMRPDLLSQAAYGETSYSEIILKESGLDNPFAIEVNDILLVPSLNTVYTNVKDVDEFSDGGGYSNTSSKETPYELVANYHKYIDKNKLPKESGSTAVTSSIPSSSTVIDPNLLSANFVGVTSSGKDYGYGYSTPGLNGFGAVGSGIGSPSIVGYDSNGNPITNSIGDTNEQPNGPSSGIPGSSTGPSGEPSGNSYVEANMANKGKSGIYVSNGKIYFGNNVSANSSDVTDVVGSNNTDNELVDCAKNGVTLGQFLNATIKNSIK
jgi:hypothetical protein